MSYSARPSPRGAVGRFGEAAAVQYLARSGYEIVQRNYRCRRGEIDVVARDGAELVFVEVRTRTSDHFGTAAESITALKARHMEACALTYLQDHAPSCAAWRVDVIAIRLAHGRVAHLEHFKHALA